MADTTIATTDKKARTFEMSLDIDASPDDVWRALTDAGELVRWFPLQARVTPGAGGRMFWSWGEGWSGESTIDAWEPPRRLRLIEERPAFDAAGQPLPGDLQTTAIEVTLETHAGKTRLRLVHSGFGSDVTWDDELESTSAGWQFELRSLRHYLERHRGKDRYCGRAMSVSSLTPPELWQRLLSPQGFSIVSGRLREGQRCVLRAATGDELAGTVDWHQPEWDLSLIVPELDSGLLRISTWRAARQTGAQIWLTTYDAQHAGRVRDFGARSQRMLEAIV